MDTAGVCRTVSWVSDGLGQEVSVAEPTAEVSRAAPPRPTAVLLRCSTTSQPSPSTPANAVCPICCIKRDIKLAYPFGDFDFL